jgi:integrase
MSKKKTQYTSVYQSESGKKYHFMFRNKVFSGFNTPEEARDARAKMIEKAPEKPGAGTFASFFVKYVEKHLYRSRPGTRYNCITSIKKHVIPLLGLKRLEDISTEDIDDLVSITSQKVSHMTANNVLNHLHIIFNKAIDWGYLIKNPSQKVLKLKVTKIEKPFLTGEELRRLLNDVEGKYKVMVALGGLAGARLGEVLGFQWQDINFDTNEISFRRQNSRFGIFDDLKSKTSHATLPMLQALVEILKKWKEQCPSKIWLFPGENKGVEFYYTISSHFTIFFKKNPNYSAQFPNKIHFHSLKHSFPSLLIDKGVEPKTVQTLCRHSTLSMTMDLYGHLYPNKLKETMNSINFQ